MKRYTDWHHTTYRGDRQLAQRYLGEGRKLLGYLSEQRASGKLQTLSIRRLYADGRVEIVASFHGDMPSLTITAAPGKSGVDATYVEGFLCRPSEEADQLANTAKNHVLLRFSSYTPQFYDAAAVPVTIDPEQSYGTYGRTWPDGLAYGNVDWRNDDQHMHVSWLGPNGRYFGATEGSYGGPLVWCKGRPLFDTREAYATDLGIFEHAVQGACLRGRLWLYVVVRNNTTETLVRMRVHSQADAALARDKGLTGVDEHYFADLALVPDSGESLVTHTIPSNNGVHPWFFNASGTVAKRIDASDGVNGNIEWTLEEDPDTGEWAFSSVQHLSGRTISETFDQDEEQIGLSYTVNATDALGNTEVNVTNSFTGKVLSFAGNPHTDTGGTSLWTYNDNFLIGGSTAGTVINHNDRHYTSRTGTYTRVDTRTETQLPAIVDFRGDEVVYGYGPVSNEVISYNRSLSDRTGSGSFTGSVTLGTPPLDYDATIAHAFDEAQTYTFNESQVRNDDGIVTDFLTFQAGVVTSNVGTESAVRTFSTSQDFGVAAGTPYETPGPTTDWKEVTEDSSSSVVTSQLELHFLDLRYQHAYLHTKVITVDTTVTGTVRRTNVGGTVTPTGAWTQNQTTTTENRVQVIVGGATVVDATDSQVSAGSGDIYTGVTDISLWDLSQSLFSNVTETGATVGYTENTTTGHFLRTLDRSSGSSLDRGGLISGSAFQMRDTLDFPGSDLFTMGSIVSKGDNFLYSLAGKDTPPTGQLPYYNGLNTGDIAALTGDQVDVVRYFPVSYLPRTVVVR